MKAGHLAEKILASKLEGERKQITVLFADFKGSMELLADRHPEEARKILDPVLERMPGSRRRGVLEMLPESQSTLEQGFEIRLELQPVLSQLGEGRQMLERLRELGMTYWLEKASASAE